MARQISKSMAHLLAASSCDLGDERAVIAFLQKAGNDYGDIIAYADKATELARQIRQSSSKLDVA